LFSIYRQWYILNNECKSPRPLRRFGEYNTLALSYSAHAA
jgi:hypothetical protein